MLEPPLLSLCDPIVTSGLAQLHLGEGPPVGEAHSGRLEGGPLLLICEAPSAAIHPAAQLEVALSRRASHIPPRPKPRRPSSP